MNRSRGKKVALSAGAVALLLVVSVGLSWRYLLMHYHFYQLKEDPPLLLEKLETAAGTPEGDAARRFVRTAAGKEVFLEEYRRVVLEPTLTDDVRNGVLEGLIWIGDGYVSYFQWGRKFLGRYGVDLKGTSTDRLRRVASFLPALEGETFRLSEYEGLGFTILRANVALESMSPPFRREASNVPEGSALTCVVRRNEDASMPILLALLADSFVTNRIDAAHRLGAKAREAIPALEAVTQEELIELFPQVKKAVSEALVRIRSDD